jgi:phage terminase Nu1 subunit (DNA packaging protein)
MLSIATLIAFVWSETSQRIDFYLSQSEVVQTRLNNVSTQKIESSAEQIPQKNENVASLGVDPTLLSRKGSKPSDPEQVLNEFDNWIATFQKINCDITQNCLDHDPRKLHHFYQKGISLSRKRAKVFENLIQSDPELALERALPKDVIEKLPQNIRDNLEKWEEGKGDILTHYGCKFTDHAACESRKMRKAF